MDGILYFACQPTPLFFAFAVPKPKPSYGISARRAVGEELPTADISDDDDEDDENEDEDDDEDEDEDLEEEEVRRAATAPFGSSPTATLS